MTLVKFQSLPFRPFMTAQPRATVNSYSRPAVNVLETATGYRIELAAPGLTREDFEIRLEQETLSVRAGVSAEASAAENGFLRREFDFNAFQISFRIPDTIDEQNIAATYRNGILTIQLSLKPEVKPVVRKVEVA